MPGQKYFWFLKGAASSYLHHLSYTPTWLSIKPSLIKVHTLCSFWIEKEITLHCESESQKENVAFSDRFVLDAKSVDVRSIGSRWEPGGVGVVRSVGARSAVLRIWGLSPDLSIHTTTTLLTPNTPSTDTRDTDTDTDTKKDKNVLTITLDNGQRYRQRHEKLLKQWKSETKRLFDRISSLPKLSEKCPIRRCKY